MAVFVCQHRGRDRRALDVGESRPRATGCGRLQDQLFRDGPPAPPDRVCHDLDADGCLPPRYVSKNNLNIARVGWLCGAFPEARVIVPFREPLQHAASLRRQHLNFLEIHRRDDFARQYMAAIGHFDFGANLRPVDFEGWCDETALDAASGLDFWLTYWTSGYSHLLREEGPRVRFSSYDAFCAAPQEGLSMLADFLELEEREVFCSAHATIHSPRPHRIAMDEADPSILEAARVVHERLKEKSKVESLRSKVE
ncbi:MAG: hypothetical protein ACREIA_10730 [Opitutaceae bacterium]